MTQTIYNITYFVIYIDDSLVIFFLSIFMFNCTKLYDGGSILPSNLMRLWIIFEKQKNAAPWEVWICPT